MEVNHEKVAEEAEGGDAEAEAAPEVEAEAEAKLADGKKRRARRTKLEVLRAKCDELDSTIGKLKGKLKRTTGSCCAIWRTRARRKQKLSAPTRRTWSSNVPSSSRCGPALLPSLPLPPSPY